MDDAKRMLETEALEFHASGRPGKLEIAATKNLTTQRDLALAYSPGVAYPCLAINKDESKAYEYTAKGNIVAVISNGTAVLGLGDIGAQAAKPVMEGKAVLFKRFADIDGFDLEVDTKDVEEFVNSVRYLGKTFGGINLEDIKAPDCFIIEQRLKELMDIPVFHDDQHGTAIITAAGMINALDLTGRSLETATMVVNGAGSAAIACVELLKSMGMKDGNVILCDSRGVIYQGREAGMNQWKSKHAVDTPMRTLEEAIKGADIFCGLSAKDAMTKDMVKSMADRPIIFAMANPDPEITPEDVAAVRSDAIVATGRSDYPNQVNNVLGFPYIFRGALDVRASEINDEMKIAAANALAELAREDVPDEVGKAYGRTLHYGEGYIIPAPFDPRLIVKVSSAVAQAAMDTGVARNPIADMDAYRAELGARLDPTSSSLQVIFDRIRANPQRVVFAEGEEERVIRAAVAFRNGGYGIPVLVGREDVIKEKIVELGIKGAETLEINNARLSEHNEAYTEMLYKRLQRKGHIQRDCQRMVNQDRNVFGACMVASGHAEAMVTGLTRNFGVTHEYVTRVLDPKPGQRLMTYSIVINRGRTIFISDTNVNELPSAEELADIAVQTAEHARSFGHTPRVALLSFSNFGYPPREKAVRIRDAVAILDARGVDFEYDGEMSADIALDYEAMKRNYPFCRLTGPANVLVMPALHSANITYKMLQSMSGAAVVGPMLVGLEKPVQIVQMSATVTDLVNAAAIAAHTAIGE
ncbi:NADP-dependent malic enzyme [Nisaea nitritireducens]|uniref:NADP-dependent malic enzyme n=1 Tax=Nisaea nitritireducens TaxID=568392 RepID=UPI001866BB1D|nr:NADP-dependent malic enzyme [Nisaea nitritireducens]